MQSYIIIFPFILCGCAWQAENKSVTTDSVAALIPKSGNGRVVVYLTNWSDFSVNRYLVSINNIPVGGVTTSSSLLLDLPPGAYSVNSGIELTVLKSSQTERENLLNTLQLKVVDGSTNFVAIRESPFGSKIEVGESRASIRIVSQREKVESKVDFTSLSSIRTSTPVTQSPSAPAPRQGLAQTTTTQRFSTTPLALTFSKTTERPDDVAIIIGNADYSRGHDIPDARTAYADAESMRRYALDGLGVREGNIIFLKDATGTQLAEVFGNERDHRGKLFNWVKRGKSRVFVYYIGHGAPGNAEGRAMLVPADASAGQIALSGYPLDLLYANLGRVPAESITVVLEACFSGTSPAGSVVGKALPIAIVPKVPPVPANVTVISAAASDQMANWEPDDSHALFTEYFLKGMSGEADKPPYGNSDGKVTLDELDRYLKETLSYWARRDYGRDQTAQIVRGGEAR